MKRRHKQLLAMGLTSLAVALSLVGYTKLARATLRGQMRCESNLRVLATGLDEHQRSHHGAMPEELHLMDSPYTNITRLFVCPATTRLPGTMSNLSQWTTYVYRPPGTETSFPGRALLYCPPANHGNHAGIVLYDDWSTERLPPDEFWKTITQGRKP